MPPLGLKVTVCIIGATSTANDFVRLDFVPVITTFAVPALTPVMVPVFSLTVNMSVSLELNV